MNGMLCSEPNQLPATILKQFKQFKSGAWTSTGITTVAFGTMVTFGTMVVFASVMGRVDRSDG